MDEQALSVALEALRKGHYITILDSEFRGPKLTFSSQQVLSFLFLWELKKLKQEGSYTSLWLMMSLLPLFSPSFERYPLPTHNSSSSFISNKFPSFPLFELFT